MNTHEYMQQLPRKRVGAGALFLDIENRVLIVKPNYKDGWLILGGTCDENESPRVTCEREVLEEIGLRLQNPRLLCVDHVTDTRGYGDALQFIFYGGVLQKEAIAAIKLQEKELSEFKFADATEAEQLLSKGMRERLPACIEAISKKEVLYRESVH